MNRIRNRRLLTVMVAISLFALASAWVAAQGPGSGAALIPYQGRLDLDGVPVDGSVDVRVGLFQSGADGTEDCLAGGTCGLWSDEFTNVPVSGGNFSVTLGSQAALSDNLFEHDALYVGLAVAPTGGTFVGLKGLQRLSSVPYAVRTERSPDLYVSGSIGVGTTTPSANIDVASGTLRVRSPTNSPATAIAGFHSNNFSQGVGVAYDGVAAIGSNTNQDLRLTPKGSGSVIVEGPLLEGAVKNVNGAESRYYRDGGRYLVQATYQSSMNARRYVEIPQDVLIDYCADEDGCTVRIGMRNYEPGITISTSMGPFAFFYGSSVVNGQRQWRRAETLSTTSGGQVLYAPIGADGNGTTNHVVQDFDCYFTDALYTVGGGGTDSGVGMGLLNYHVTGSVYTPDCWLTIDD